MAATLAPVAVPAAAAAVAVATGLEEDSFLALK